MKILHYANAFFGARGGGLVRYATDILIEQKKRNMDVCYLYPGMPGVIDKKVKIIKEEKNGIYGYYIKNAIPCPGMEGVKNPERYLKHCDQVIWDNFFSDVKPDIIHLHTLQGLFPEFFVSAKKYHIKIIYTTHDYYGLCPHSTLLFNDKKCRNVINAQDCEACNRTAAPLYMVIFAQSKTYGKIRNMSIIKYLKKNRYSFHKRIVKNPISTVEQYRNMQKYYKRMFEYIDFFHFNSFISEVNFRKYLGEELTGKKILISHAKISKTKVYNSSCPNDTIRFTYLGSISKYKGYYLLKEALDKVYKNKHNFILNLCVKPTDVPNYANLLFLDGYNYDDLKYIYTNTDILITPSIWDETFGFVVLESLSFGIPVITTECVGANELIQDGINGYVVKCDCDELVNKINYLLSHIELVHDMKKHIRKGCANQLTIGDHVNKLEKYCYKS